MDKLRLYSSDVFIIIVAAIALVFRIETADTTPPFDAYPKLISGALILLAIACLIQSRFSEASSRNESSGKKVLKAIALIIGIAIYILAISSVGYFVSSSLYLFVMFHLKRVGNREEFLETKPILTDSLVSLLIVCGIAVVFKFALNLVFPESWLF